MKHPVFLLISLSAAILIGGVSLAYYNTRTMGFDEDAAVIVYYDESIKIMDFEIEYQEVKDFLEKVNDYIPENPVTV